MKTVQTKGVSRTPQISPGPRRIALAGGGTGGHLVPGLHLLQTACRLGQAPEKVLWFTSGRPVEKAVLRDVKQTLPDIDLEVLELPLETEGGGAPSTLGLLRRSPRAYGLARRALRTENISVLLGLGGFTALPCVVAAKRQGIPVALYEVNAVPGRATRRLGGLACQVYHAWPQSVPTAGGAKHRVIGPVVGPDFDPGEEPDPEPLRGQRVRSAKVALGLDPARPLLCVLGGSQGAGSLNTFVTQYLGDLVGAGWQVLHQTGPGKLAQGAGLMHGYHVKEYLPGMHAVLAAADLVLGRGGASTVAELAAMEVPAWIVPYPHHPDRHQWRNAEVLGKGARVVEQDQLESTFGGTLAQELASLTRGPGREQLQLMRRALRVANRKRAAATGIQGAQNLWAGLGQLVKA